MIVGLKNGESEWLSCLAQKQHLLGGFLQRSHRQQGKVGTEKSTAFKWVPVTILWVGKVGVVALLVENIFI